MRGKNAQDGDTRVAPNGYHYTKENGKWRLTHHIVAERALGRSLTGAERVSFKDGDRENLSPENILVAPKKNTKQDRIARLKERIAALQQELKDLEHNE
jgi:hypothetical protein